MENLALLAAVGGITGFFSGLFGIGGGIIIVPALMLVLPHLGVAGPDLIKIAMATSLATTVVTSMSSSRQHIASGAVNWTFVLRLGPGIVVGAIAGSQLSPIVNSQMLTVLFIGFLVYGAWTMVRGRPANTSAHAPIPNSLDLTIRGIATGGFCSMLGIGCALFLVPMLAAYISFQRSIGTAAALGLPLALAATFGYMAAPEPVHTCPAGCVGFVYLTAAGAIATATIATAPIGAWATHVLPTKPLKWAFALLMLVIAGHLSIKSLPSIKVAAAQHIEAATLPAWLGTTAKTTADTPLAAEVQTRGGNPLAQGVWAE
jgi:uncharacterized membrane protein YfcA